MKYYFFFFSNYLRRLKKKFLACRLSRNRRWARSGHGQFANTYIPDEENALLSQGNCVDLCSE